MTSSQHLAQQLVLGVDGGQSGTQTVLATAEGEILAAAVTGPVTHVETRDGLEQVVQVLRQGYEHVFAAAGRPIAPLSCVHLGLSGVNDPELLKAIYQTEMLTSSGDAHILLSAPSLSIRWELLSRPAPDRMPMAAVLTDVSYFPEAGGIIWEMRGADPILHNRRFGPPIKPMTDAVNQRSYAP
jgi:hypothetical protein